jgi:hypothetical protein
MVKGSVSSNLFSRSIPRWPVDATHLARWAHFFHISSCDTKRQVNKGHAHICGCKIRDF